MKSNTEVEATDWRRILVGVLALSFLGLGTSLYFFETGSTSGIHGVLVRLGFVLGTIWLAMPQLGKLTMLQSAGAVLIVAGMIVLAASRPNIFRVAATLLAVGLAINWGLKWVSLLGSAKK